MGSPTFNLDKEDALKIAKGAGIAVGGTLCAYGIGVLPLVNLGDKWGWLAPFLMVALNAGLKFFNDTQKKEQVVSPQQ